METGRHHKLQHAPSTPPPLSPIPLQGYTGPSCATCAAGWVQTAEGACIRADPAPAPTVGPLFGLEDTPRRRHLMAQPAADDARDLGSLAGGSIAGAEGEVKAALSLPSAWLAGAVFAACVGMVAAGVLLLVRVRPTDLPL